MKRSFLVLLSVLLLLPFFPASFVKHAAASTNSFEVLEIVSQLSSPSPLQQEIGSRQDINITTMTMKRFVALRDELDGKYDAIVISKGDYSPASVKSSPDSSSSQRARAHDTRDVMNDITNLRAQQIKQFYIDKGLPVFLHQDVFKYTDSKLYQQFKQYRANTASNVIVFQNQTGLANYLANRAGRPRVQVTSAPSSTQVFKKGDSITFSYQIVNYQRFSNKLLTVNLYIDSDFNDQYTNEEIVASREVKSQSGTISYTFPAGFSGVRYWKLEVVDEATALKDYEKGYVKFQDVVPKINVLQIRSGNDASSLLNSKNMNQSYLKRTNEYEISIDVTTLSDFQKSRQYEPNYSHEVINGKYDMIIFGFADCYNGCNNPINLNANAVQSVKNFIATGQSVMFTHDIMFGKNNVWVNEFGPIVGQIQPQTDLGNGAPNTSTSTKRVNSGLITDYPFQLADNITVATTHNQYYTLDLEDSSVIPWYNIVGSNRDVYDSWNHYYTYSKGNVTYSGTGHVGTSAGFPDDEQKLFVNTMYRAFFGSNHAPQLTVFTPRETEEIPSNQKIELSYKVEDLDLTDRTLATKVWLNGNEVYSNSLVPNGTTVIQSIPHQMPNGGKATIKIEVTDAKGAKVTKEFQVTIQRVTANLEVSRSITATLTPVDRSVTVEYTLNPKQLSLTTNSPLTVTNIQFQEKLPAGVEVTSLPNGFTKQGSIDQGYTITGKLPDISYQQNGSLFTAPQQTFAIQLTPTKKGEFSLQQATLSYQDLNGQTANLSFNPLRFVSDYEITSVSLPDTVFINRGVPKNLNLLLSISPQNATVASIEWSEASNGSIVSVDKMGVLTAINKGSAEVTVKVKDAFGNERTAKTKAIVRIPVDSIEMSDFTVRVGETIPIPITVTPADARESVAYSIGDNRYADLDQINGTITGKTEGVTTLTAKAFDADDQLVEKTVNVTVRAVPVESVTVFPATASIHLHDKLSLKVTILPENATNKQVQWRSSDASIATVDENGTVVGVGTGTAVITATAHNGVQGTAVIHVGVPLTGISLPSTITVEKGKTFSVRAYLAKIPANATTSITSYEYHVEDSYYAVVDDSGEVTGKRLGQTVLTVQVTDENSKVWTATTTIRIVEHTDHSNGGENGWLY
ncbi:DUF5057 domain-containing protein [Anoxybacteroides rupiense]|uniref:DUF5057 domain-containing protein n=1 Tax=Anoxybacteroides rupiense TaxID=311460 RepID=UPI001605FB8F|nr:DUF5057 domain-containing protein [Anoxybacillus rupiensis]MBB3907179.1 uncharacterized protein YjdB [Anoxybacillus rupiensis]